MMGMRVGAQADRFYVEGAEEMRQDKKFCEAPSSVSTTILKTVY